MTANPDTRRSRRVRPGPGAAPYRNDVDGLRAVAILLVVIYHVWIGRVSGGVDVFLMISAFFLTGSFLRRMQDGRPLAVGSFLLSRFRRLMPAASVVLVATLLASWLLLSQTTWPQLWRQGWASLGYVQNWALATEGVDYYAGGSTLLSPLQHFWSLSVQGQVFVLWPLLFLVGALIVRATGRPAAVMAALFGAVFAASFAFSIVETANRQGYAYFDTRTRLWEFAAGSLLAIALPGVGAFLFGCFVVLFQWLGMAFRADGRPSPGILLVPVFCVVFGHLALFFVTLPMGYFSQWTMQKIGSSDLGRSDRPPSVQGPT